MTRDLSELKAMLLPPSSVPVELIRYLQRESHFFEAFMEIATLILEDCTPIVFVLPTVTDLTKARRLIVSIGLDRIVDCSSVGQLNNVISRPYKSAVVVQGGRHETASDLIELDYCLARIRRGPHGEGKVIYV